MQWIKINSEKDLPKADGEYVVKMKNENDLPEDKLTKDLSEYSKEKGWAMFTEWTVVEYLDESISHTTDLSKVFDENADTLKAENPSVLAMSKPRFISTVEKLLDAKTDAPFPDKMTFKEFLQNMFNVDFMSADELQTICDAAEMYANGCIKNAQTDASGLIDKWEKEEPKFVYEALYNPCIHESAPATISIHLTKEGAEKAIEFHKNEKRKEWEERVNGMEQEFKDHYTKSISFGKFEHWSILETQIAI